MIKKGLRLLPLCILGTIMACSNAVSPDVNASDKLSSSSSLKLSSAGTSSSSSGTSSSSSSSSSMRDEVSKNLGTVSTLALSKNASGSWILIWSYTSGDLAEEGFQIDTFNDSKNSWEAFDAVPANTYRYTFETSRAGVYRVSAFAAKTRSNFSNDVEVGSEPTLIDLPKPSALTAKRLAPSVWQLSWTFATSADRRESGFILQKYNVSAQNWVVWDTLAQDVKRVVLDSVVAGVDLSIGSYRIATYDSKGRSDFSNDIEVSIQTKYDEDVVFVPPTSLVPNVVKIDYIEVVIPTNPMNKSVEYSPYTQALSYEVIWVIGDTEKPVDEFSYSKNSVRYLVLRDDLCNSYARIRLVWTDVNGIVDYSEWSVPSGSKPGTADRIVDVVQPDSHCIVK